MIKNNYEIENGIVKIDISTKSHPETFTYIDESSLEMLNTHGVKRISAVAVGKKGEKRIYAVMAMNKMRMYLHKVLAPNPSEKASHVDGDTLNNRVSNIANVKSNLTRKLPTENPEIFENSRDGSFELKFVYCGHTFKIDNFKSISEAEQGLIYFKEKLEL